MWKTSPNGKYMYGEASFESTNYKGEKVFGIELYNIIRGIPESVEADSFDNLNRKLTVLFTEAI